MPRGQVHFPEPEPVDIGAERLRVLAEFLPSVPSEAFDISEWACGTTACACGHAATIPEFRAAGLWLKDIRNAELFPGWKIPCYGEHEGFDAAAAFFGISFGDADYLFGPLSYPLGRATAVDVATRIREYLTERAAQRVESVS